MGRFSALPVQALQSMCALIQAVHNVVTTAKLIGAAKAFGDTQRPKALTTHSLIPPFEDAEVSILREFG